MTTSPAPPPPPSASGMVEVDIDADVVDAARDAAARSGRSVEEQVAFWVRLGREVERSSRGER